MTLEITQFDFLSRLLWALAIIGGGIGLYGLVNRWACCVHAANLQGWSRRLPACRCCYTSPRPHVHPARPCSARR